MADLTPGNFIAVIKAMNQADRNKITKVRLLELITEAEINVNPYEAQRLDTQERQIQDLLAKFDEIKNDVRHNTQGIGNVHGLLEPLLENAPNPAPNPKIAELEIELIKMQQQINDLEQYNRSNNIEIVGLPVASPEENNEDIILEALNSLPDLAFPVQSADIDVSHPIKSRRKDKKQVNICKFVSRKCKYMVIEAKKKVPDLKFRDNVVYINEHLSPVNRSIFAQAAQKRRQLNYKHLWTNNGITYMRKEDGTEVITIDSEEALNTLA